jgi:hypothetical protein
MALAGYALPFGLRQVVLTPILANGTLDTANRVKLPAARTFTFAETEDFEELEGDDIIQASHGDGPTVDWELEGGGISLDIWKILSGGTITASGTSPAATRTFTKLNTDARPYFQVEGRAISDNGGDFHGIVYRCQANKDLKAEMSNGSFMLTNASGKGYGDSATSKLYDFVHNETAAVIPFDGGVSKTGWSLTIGGTPTGGTYRLLVQSYATPDIAYNAAAAAIQSAINGLSSLTGVTATVTGASSPYTITLTAARTLQTGSVALTPSGTATVA